MDYGSNIKVHSIDASNFQADRTVTFRLQPNTVYRSNLRIINAGWLDSANTNAKINEHAGAWGNVKSIRLVDKGVELSKTVDVHPYVSFNLVQGSNSGAVNVVDPKVRTMAGLTLKASNGLSTGGASLPANARNLIGTGEQIGTKNTNANVTNAIPVNGVLDLSRCLPILSVLQYIPTNLFDDLRVVIEFRAGTTASLYAGKDVRQNVTNVGLPNIMSLQAEEVLGREGQMAMDNLSSFSWNEIESDELVIRNAVQNVEQSHTKRIKAFDNKSLNRILMFTVPQDDAQIFNGNAVLAYGRNNSITQNSSKINFVVNGRTLFTGEGLTTNASRMACCQDAWGDYICHIGSNEISMDDQAGWLEDGANRIGQEDYVGANVGQKIQDLQLQYKRTDPGAVGAGRNHIMVLKIYGEVGKSLVLNAGGSYNIVYN